MADGRVIIDASLDTSDIRRDVQAVNQELGQIGSTMPTQATVITNQVGERFDSLGRRIREVYKGTSPEAQRMSAEIRSAFAQQRVAMNGFRDDMIGVQYGYFQMAKGAKDYTGTNEQFMAGIETMGKKHKKINDDMMAANDMQKMNFYQSVGSMLARSTQASKISDNFDRIGNPLYKVNNGLLSVADGMNKIAMRGQPAALALKMLGPSANMKQLNDMTMMISQGLMRFTMIAMIAAVAAGVFYGAMHKGAMETNAAYAEAFSGMLVSVKRAFEPMIEVFAAVMTHVWNFIKAIADMVARFNQANPMLAKIIAGFLLLIPALTLILSPLAIGIGLFGGLSAAMGAVWMIIGPMVTGFAAMMGTVLLVAAVIVGLVVVIRHLWQTNEGFRNAIISAWNAIKAAAIAAWGFIKPYIMQAIQAVVTFVQTQLTAIAAFWQANGTQIMGIVTAAWNIIKTVIQVALNLIKTIFQGVFPIIVTIVQTAWTTIQTVITVATALIGGIIRTWLAVFRGDWSGAWNSVKSTYQTIWNAIKSFLSVVLQAMLSVITSLFNLFKSVIQSAMNGIKTVVTTIWNAIKSTVVTILNGIKLGITNVMNAIKSVISNVWNAIKTVISTALNAIRSTVTSVWNAIKASITSVVNAIKSTITSAWNAIKTTVTGAMNAIKATITSAWNAAKATVISVVNGIKTTVTSVFNSLKTVVSTAMNGVKTAISNGWNAAKSFLDGIDLSGVGKNIIQGLIGGITSMVGAVGKAISGIASSIKKGIAGAMDVHSPSRWMRDKIGKMLPAGIAVGIKANTGAATSALNQMAKDMMYNAPRQMAANISARQPSVSPQMAVNGSQVINLNIDGQQVGQVIVPTVNRMQERQRSFKAFNKGVR